MTYFNALQRMVPFLLLCLPGSSIAAEFVQGTNFSLPAGPIYVVSADFNADGKLDLATINLDANSVSILIGNGDGTFQPAVSYATQNVPVGLAVGDLNGDGKLDLAVTNESSRSVSIFLGNGDGSFQNSINTPVPLNFPYGIALADLDGDGRLDAAVTNLEFANGQVLVMLGKGDGTFLSPVTYPINASHSIAVVAADFNKDGHLDLAVTNNCDNKENCTAGHGTVTIFLGNGDGTFQFLANPQAGYSTFSVVVTELNGDGNLDLAVCDEFNTGVMLGRGDGTFKPIITFKVTSDIITEVAVGDVNNDGIPDLIATDISSDAVQVMLGRSSGGLFNHQNDYYPAISSLAASALGDFNGDGLLDIVSVGGHATGEGTVLLNTGGIAVATFSPTSLDFGNVKIDTKSQVLPVTLGNNGTGPMNVTKITIFGNDGPRFRQSNTCTQPIPVGGGCTINVQFEPFQTRKYTATLAVTDDALGMVQSIQVSGTGVP